MTSLAEQEAKLGRTQPAVSVEALAKYDTPTICNAIELFKGRSPVAGYTDHRIRCWFENLPPMVGYACTATYRSAAPASTNLAGTSACASKEVAHLVESFGTVPGPAVVVFQDLDDPPAAACFGDISCGTYKTFGAVGLITSGAGRDLPQVEALNFPIFASSAICSHGYGHLTSIGAQVRIGGLAIEHGDLLHGDRNGVVKIPHTIAPYVAGVAEQVYEAEKPVFEFFKTANPSVKAYRDVIQDMQNRLEKIKAGLADI